jgi:hypothetical protein
MRQTILDLSDASKIFEQIISHWQRADAQSQLGPIGLKGGFGVGAFRSDADQFASLGLEIEESVKVRDIASERLNLYKENMRNALQSFCYLVRGLYPDSDYSKGLPTLADARSSEQVFLAPLERMALIWRQINTVRPLQLPSGVDYDEYVRGLIALKQAFKTREKAFVLERKLRAERRVLHKNLVTRSVQYRQVVQGLFGATSDIAAALPYLWPEQDRSKKRKETVVAPPPVTENVFSALQN